MTIAYRLDDDRVSLRLWGWSTWVSIAVVCGVLTVLISKLDIAKVWMQITAANMTLVLLGGLAHYATYMVRGARWRRCLSNVSPDISARSLGLLVFFYNAVDNIMPAKLGDVYAAHLVHINCGVGRAPALGSIVLLRTIDAWSVLLLASLASWWIFATHLPHVVLWSLLLGILLAFAATCIVLICLLCSKPPSAWLPQRVRHALHALHSGMRPTFQQLLSIALLTGLIWTLETIGIIALVLAFDVTVGPFEGLFLTMLPLLASAFPLTPSGAGVVELTLFSCLRLLGVPASTAASVTVLNRLIDYWLHIALGSVTWACRNLIGLRTWRDVPPDTALTAAEREPVIPHE